MRIRQIFYGAFLSSIGLWGNPVDQKLSFVLDEPTRVPGIVLQPGSYQIELLDYLPDRSVLQIKGASGKVQTTFVGVPAKADAGLKKQGLSSWPNATGGQTSLRGWWTPKEHRVLEFAYPKDDAVEIAKANHTPVPAIDPESEGKGTINTMKSDDMKIVGLWLLSTSSVDGSDQVQAEHYSSPRTTTISGNVNSDEAKLLPKTGSLEPLIGLIGIVCLLVAGLRSLKFT